MSSNPTSESCVKLGPQRQRLLRHIAETERALTELGSDWEALPGVVREKLLATAHRLQDVLLQSYIRDPGLEIPRRRSWHILFGDVMKSHLQLDGKFDPAFFRTTTRQPERM